MCLFCVRSKNSTNKINNILKIIKKKKIIKDNKTVHPITASKVLIRLGKLKKIIDVFNATSVQAKICRCQDYP